MIDGERGWKQSSPSLVQKVLSGVREELRDQVCLEMLGEMNPPSVKRNVGSLVVPFVAPSVETKGPPSDQQKILLYGEEEL